MSITATTTTSAMGTKLPSLTNNKSPNSSEVSANPFNSLKAKSRFNSAIDVVTDAQSSAKPGKLPLTGAIYSSEVSMRESSLPDTVNNSYGITTGAKSVEQK